MVARQTGPTCLCTTCPMVSHSKSPTTIKEILTTVASPDARPSISMPHSILQDGFYQACCCPGSTLQSQKSHRRLVHLKPSGLHWSSYKSAALNPSDPHWVLAGSLLHSLLPPELAVIAEGSLSNKVLPSKKEYHNQMRLGMKNWTKRNGLPSMPHSNMSDLCHHLWSEHTHQITNHMKSPPSPSYKPPLKVPFSTARTNILPLFAYTAHAYIINPSNRPSKILRALNNFQTNPCPLSFKDNMGRSTLGQSDLANNSHQATFWQKERKTFEVVDPSFLLWTHLSVLCSTSLPV